MAKDQFGQVVTKRTVVYYGSLAGGGGGAPHPPHLFLPRTLLSLSHYLSPMAPSPFSDFTPTN
jgi:hypothetical protein